jgi:iron complex outermembrane recepter protein
VSLLRLGGFCQVIALLAAAGGVVAQVDPAIEEEIIVVAPRTVGALEVVTDPGKPRQPLPAHDGADYLKTIPGFSVTRKGGTDGDPLFRGMAGSRVNILSDDALLLGGCGARMDPPTAYVFPQNYDRIRVLKGPQSVRWGAGGTAATVRFERDDYDHADQPYRVRASALAASWGRRDLAFDGQAGTPAGYLRLRGSDARADNYEDGAGQDVPSRYRRWNANLALGWTPTARTLVELSGARSDGEAAYADRGMDGSKFARDAVTLRVRQQELTERVSEVEAHLSWGHVDHVMDNYSLRDFQPNMMMPNPSASNPDRETLALRLGATVELAPAFSAVVGFDAHADEHRIRNSMNVAMMPYQALPRVRDARFEQYGAYTEVTFRQTPGRQWVSGFRLDRWEVEDHRATVGQGMMSGMRNATAGAKDRDWLSSAFVRFEQHLDLPRVAGNLRLFAGLGRAERVADYWERFGSARQSPDTNSAFFTDPERVTQLDFGVIGTTPRSRWSASLFVNRIDDYILIDARPFNKPMNIVVARNVDAGSWGGELEYTLAFGGGLTLDSTLAYTRAENRSDGAPLAQMPPLEGRMALNWTQERLTLGSLLRLVAAQDRIDPGRGNIAGQDIDGTGGFAVLSVNGSYRFTDGAGLSIGIDNLFDRRYAEHLSRAGAAVSGYVQSEQINEPGRTAWLKLDLAI